MDGYLYISISSARREIVEPAQLGAHRVGRLSWFLDKRDAFPVWRRQTMIYRRPGGHVTVGHVTVERRAGVKECDLLCADPRLNDSELYTLNDVMRHAVAATDRVTNKFIRASFAPHRALYPTGRSTI